MPLFKQSQVCGVLYYPHFGDKTHTSLTPITNEKGFEFIHFIRVVAETWVFGCRFCIKQTRHLGFSYFIK